MCSDGEREGYHGVVAGHGDRIEHHRAGGEGSRRGDPGVGSLDPARSERREDERRHHNERHLRGEQGGVASFVRAEERRWDEGGEAARRVLEKEVAVGECSAQDGFSGLAVDLEVVRVLPEVRRQSCGQGDQLPVKESPQQGERRPEKKQRPEGSLMGSVPRYSGSSSSRPKSSARGSRPSGAPVTSSESPALRV